MGHQVRIVVSYLLLSVIVVIRASSRSDSISRPRKCQERCGDIEVPYPFGLGSDPNCYRNDRFKLRCNSSTNPPQLIYGETNQNIRVLGSISISQGTLTISTKVCYECYNSSGGLISNRSDTPINLQDSPFTLSSISNVFVGIGCDTIAPMLIIDPTNETQAYASGCISYCTTAARADDGRPCIGNGCCQANIAENIKQLSISVLSPTKHKDKIDFNPCSYSFLAEKEWYKFSVSHLKSFKPDSVPTVVDWWAGPETCAEAKTNLSNYACRSENSICYPPNDKGIGYRCNCSKGFKGNPYMKGGCTDTDECSPDLCIGGKCTNTQGSYTCIPETKNKKENNPLVTILLANGLSLLFLLLLTISAYCLWRKRERSRLKDKYFEQNGGLFLLDKFSSHAAQRFKIFPLDELKKATDNYNSSNILGQGGFGVVYKGTLPDNTLAAIKKPKSVDTSQVEQFINELLILSKINHKNVVGLLGCCLENVVPILVYEFVPNRTLYYHIHEASNGPTFLPLGTRLRIAKETAEALAYLHSSTSIPVLHRDIKSANILLDHKFRTKVSDFGISKLVSVDDAQKTTLMQGTWGYIDPETFQTGLFTDKSDVYSFGIILLELLTGKKPICPNAAEGEKNLAQRFISMMKANRLHEILEERIRYEGQEEQLMAIARLALRCLNVKGEERPAMTEVALMLKELSDQVQENHPWVQEHGEEAENLLGENSQHNGKDSTGDYSTSNSSMLSINVDSGLVR